MSADSNRALAIKFLTTMKDHGGLDESLITDDFQWWGQGQGWTTKDAIKTVCAQMKPTMPLLPEMTVIATTAEADRVAVELQGKCGLTNGKRYDNVYHFMLECKDGKVRRVKEYCDTQLAAGVFGNG